MSFSFVVRMSDLGGIAGQVEVVETGEVQVFRGPEELMRILGRSENTNPADPVADQIVDLARLGLDRREIGRAALATPAAIDQALSRMAPAPDESDESPPRWSICLLGGFSVHRSGSEIRGLGVRPASLLKRLAVEGCPITVDEAIEHLWPEGDPQSGRSNLRTVLARIRKAAGDIVVRNGDTVGLEPSVEVDIRRFERLAVDSGCASRTESLEASLQAIDCYTGPLLPVDAFEDWVVPHRERARARFIELLHRAAHLSAAIGGYAQAEALLERAIECEPFDEDGYVELARLHARRQRPGAARRVLDRSTSAMAELGLAPSVTFEQLSQAS